jgi:hypothetical protein
MDYIGNHCMSVITDGESYERVLLFGGISNTIGDGKNTLLSGNTTPANGKKGQDRAVTHDVNQVTSFLSNRCFLINIQ